MRDVDLDRARGLDVCRVGLTHGGASEALYARGCVRMRVLEAARGDVRARVE